MIHPYTLIGIGAFLLGLLVFHVYHRVKRTPRRDVLYSVVVWWYRLAAVALVLFLTWWVWF
jgi:hypothetical protein